MQRADILGGRTFAMRVWLKPDGWPRSASRPRTSATRSRDNNYLSALGETKGSMVSVNLVANTDLQTADEFKNLVVKQKDKGVVVRLGEIADVVLGAENYDSDVRFNGQTATFMGIWVLPTANSLDVIKRVRAAMPEIQAQLPAGMTAGIPYDSTLYIQDAIDEVSTTLAETLLIVIIVIFLFLGSFRSVLIPIVAIPISLDRRGLPDARRGLHDQPADAARDRALGRPRRRRRHRHRRERRAPPPARPEAVRGRHRARRGSSSGRSSR